MIEGEGDRILRVLSHLEGWSVQIDPRQCSRVRHRRSACRLCTDHCPAEAIVWGDSLHVDPDKCTGCDICTAVCPTGALEARAPSRDEVLEQILRALRHQDWVAFACPQALKGAAGGTLCLSVRCLGRLDESLLVSAVAHGAQQVWLVEGACGGCPQAAGREVVGAAASRSNALLAAFGRPAAIKFRADLPGVPPQRGNGQGAVQGVSRRGMFKVLARETARVSESTAEARPNSRMQEQPAAQLRGELPHAVPGARVLLLAALMRLGLPVERDLHGNEEGRFARFSLGEGCTACQMCAYFCPTGALTRVDDGDRTGLSFSVASCTNCGLCRDICYRDAVRLDHQVNLHEVLALSVEWQFVQDTGGAPWDDPPDRRIGRQILKSLLNATE